MEIGNIKQFGIGGTINTSELKELQKKGELSKNVNFGKYDIDGDGRIEQKEVFKIEGGDQDGGSSRSEDSKSSRGSSRSEDTKSSGSRGSGGSVNVVQEGKFDNNKKIDVGQGDHYVIIHTSHANDKSKSVGSITGPGVQSVKKSGDGDNGIIIAKVTGPSSVNIDSNGAGSSKYAVVKGGGGITAFGGDDAGYPMGGKWTKVNGGGDAFYISAGDVGTPKFYSTERNKVHGNTVTASS